MNVSGPLQPRLPLDAADSASVDAANSALTEASETAPAEGAHLRFAPDTLVHLGERLIPHIEQGIVELAKNAYDADAEKCTVTLKDGGRTIIVSDTGAGMDEAGILNGWLVLGRSSKRDKALTPRFQRVPVGDKGLGRLAALRLGRRAVLRTRPASEPGVQYSVVLDWARYEQVGTVEEVSLTVNKDATSLGQGTDIEVSDLRKVLTRADLDKLARSLILLSSPFEAKREFKVVLEAPEFKDLEERVSKSYFDAAQYRIDAEVGADGFATFRLLDWKGEQIAPNTRSATPYATVPAHFELWVFSLDSSTFSTRNARLGDVRAWLKIFGGVHVFEGPIRVPPYGSEGNDWLEMNLRRARSPEGRPSTNNSVGRVVVENASGRLVQKTDRVGYVEDATFQELRRFAVDALDWANKEVMKPIEAERVRRREEEERERREAQESVAKAVENLGAVERKSVEVAIKRMANQQEKQVRSLRADLQLYRSLATAGMTSAVFAHEIGKPLNMMRRNLPKIEEALPPEKRQSLGRVLMLVRNAAERLNTFVSLPLTLLAKDKRRVGRINLISTLEELVSLYGPIFETAQIAVELNFPSGAVFINGSVSLIDGIFANLFANSITAFQREGVAVSQRRIRIVIEKRGGHADVRIADNAGGIRDISVSEIWLPGVTTTPDGTGFGLTIVKDSVSDLGGTVAVKEICDYGGAEFLLELPTVEGEG